MRYRTTVSRKKMALDGPLTSTFIYVYICVHIKHMYDIYNFLCTAVFPNEIIISTLREDHTIICHASDPLA